jgi:hypothetical protein
MTGQLDEHLAEVHLRLSAGSLACGTNPARPSPRARSSAATSARRRCTYLATYEYDTSAPCSSRSRSNTRRAVCRCLRRASRSSRSMPSTSPATRSRTGASRSATLRSGGSGELIAWRTVRRCTSYLLPAPDRHLVALPVEADRREQLRSPLHPGPIDERNTRHRQRSARLSQMSPQHAGVPSAPPALRGQIREGLPPCTPWSEARSEENSGPLQSARASLAASPAHGRHADATQTPRSSFTISLARRAPRAT